MVGCMLRAGIVEIIYGGVYVARKYCSVSVCVCHVAQLPAFGDNRIL